MYEIWQTARNLFLEVGNMESDTFCLARHDIVFESVLED